MNIKERFVNLVIQKMVILLKKNLIFAKSVILVVINVKMNLKIIALNAQKI